MRLKFIAATSAALSLVGCGGDRSSDAATASAPDGGAGDAGTTGGSGGGTTGDGGTGGAAGGTGGAAGATSPERPAGPLVEYGFSIGLPQVHTLSCSHDGITSREEQVADSDWLCTFDYASTLGYVYVQATAVSCTFRYTISTTFETRAWLSLDGQVTELTDAHYDWGDYHHVDYLTFGHGALSFEYGHSSLGSSYRPCYPMDCMTVRDATSGAVIEDGCTSERTLPVTCVPIHPDGTHRELVDHFVSCEDLAAHPEQWCAYGGGTPSTVFCCSGYEDYPDSCTSLSCTCPTENSRDVIVCVCPDGQCFDGNTCIYGAS